MNHPGVGTGTGRIKIGDGTTAYTSLPYFINPDDFIAPTASGVTYDNSTSGLSATTVQGAIDEMNSFSIIKHGYAECPYAAGTKRNILNTIHDYISTLFDGQKHINIESISLSGMGYYGNLQRKYESFNHDWALFQPISLYNDPNYKFIHTSITLSSNKSATSVIAGLANGSIYIADQSNDSISAGTSKITYTWY